MLTMQKRGVLREGLVLGLIGAGLVAVWFLLVDGIAGRPLFTPAVLGSAVLFGRDVGSVTIAVQPVLVYTAFHLVAFLVAGIVIAAIMAEARKDPHVLWLLLEFFIVFQFGFYAAVGLAFRPVLVELTWLNVAVGNLLAAGGMGLYLWRTRETPS
jgi:NAD/NADP transhydrogenase beta subunit